MNNNGLNFGVLAAAILALAWADRNITKASASLRRRSSHRGIYSGIGIGEGMLSCLLILILGVADADEETVAESCDMEDDMVLKGLLLELDSKLYDSDDVLS